VNDSLEDERQNSEKQFNASSQKLSVQHVMTKCIAFGWKWTSMQWLLGEAYGRCLVVLARSKMMKGDVA